MLLGGQNIWSSSVFYRCGLDTLGFLLRDGQHKEVDYSEFILKGNPIQKEEEEKEDEEVEEEKESDKKSKGYQTSEEADE